MNAIDLLPRLPVPFIGFAPSPHHRAWASALTAGAIGCIAIVCSSSAAEADSPKLAQPMAFASPPSDPSRAIGGAVAWNDFGISQLHADGVPSHAAIAFEAFEHSCRDGSPDGCSNLGALYERGIGVSTDVARAVRLYEHACATGAALGCSNLGALYAKGLGVARNQKQAVRLFELACETGSATGCENLIQLTPR